MRTIDRSSEGVSHEPPLRFALFPAVASDVGTLPQLAYGFSLAASLLVGRFRGELYGAYWPNQTAHGPAADEGADIELAAGGSRGCFALLAQSVELAPCAGLEVGALHGSGVNLMPSLNQTGLWLAVTLDARAVLRVSKAFGIAVDLGAAIPLRRDEFTAGASATAPDLHKAGVIEARASIGPEVRF
jgi:hypothetical protein